jgi:hypothetical protein
MIESSTLVGSLQRTGQAIWEMLPDLLLALVLLIAGWLVAKIIRRAAIRFLRSLHVDDLAERAGFEDFLIQGGVQVTTVTLIGNTIYWLILAGVFVALLDGLGMRSAGALLERMVLFIPNLVLAVGILVFGSLLARVVGALVFSYLSNVGSPAAEPIGALARYALLIFILFMAAEQLAIQSEVLVSAFQIAFAALCFAAALAFGLGGRHWAAKQIERYMKNR